MGSHKQVMYAGIENIDFRMYTDEEIEKISVLKVINDESINAMGHLVNDGVYDLRLGPMSSKERDVCGTCMQVACFCPGHCGHIDIPLPVYNPFFYNQLREILTRICCHCASYQAKEIVQLQLIYQVKLVQAGYGKEALNVPDLINQYSKGYLQNEAIEVNKMEEVESVIQSISTRVNQVKKIEKMLIKYTKKLISSCDNNTENSTSNNKSIYLQVVKQFLNSVVSKSKCLSCSLPMKAISFQNSRFMFNQKKNAKLLKVKEEEEAQAENSSNINIIEDSQSYISPEQAENLIRKCWQKNSELLKHVYPMLQDMKQEYPTDIFFLHRLLVIPPKYRPCNVIGGSIVENETSVLLKNVVRLSKALSFVISVINKTLNDIPDSLKYIFENIPGKSHLEKMHNVWLQLQGSVDNILDAESNALVNVTRKGIRQIIEKKEGLFRLNLMGKRVNYSARSVAAPDPMLSVDQVGVPMDFAKKLTYPVPVTNWNAEKLRQLIINGPDVYPGACLIEDEEGKKIWLNANDSNQRMACANKLLTHVESHVKKVNMSKIVYRHLENNDFVLMNRQPTLHRPSIQAHRARVMPNDRVLRMPYANCKAYNADFDGDELNLHFPQNDLARSECSELITTHNQYLTPKDGSPLAGLIQDCVVSSVMLTIRGNFFSREDYNQLVLSALAGSDNKKINTVPPTIIKPSPLWSGKQVISTVLLNIIPKDKAKLTFNFKTSVKVNLWQTVPERKSEYVAKVRGRRENMTESEFVMLNGELLCGVVDKSAIGSTSYGLIHTCYELYGGNIAANVLSAINRLSVFYLQWVGHTISVKEFITEEKVSRKRRKRLAELVKNTPSLVATKLEVGDNTTLSDYIESMHVVGNEKEISAIDAAYTSILNPTASDVTEANEQGLYRKNLDNHMKMMVDTGSKGSRINMNQMASLFGSVAVDGKRMTMSAVGKTLPSFKPYETNPCAGGFIPRRFMTGMDPQSYFWLCIAGRDSLQHTAVKTANSGYMQRCLIKHLEGIQVHYDTTVRNSDGLVLQFKYGEDGMDVIKVPFLKNIDTMETLADNYHRLLDARTIKMSSSTGDPEAVEKYRNKLNKWIAKHKMMTGRKSGFLRFCAKLPSDVRENLEVDVDNKVDTKTGRYTASKKLEQLWREMTPADRHKHEKSSLGCPDPVSSVFFGESNLGVISEALESLIDNYYETKYSKRRYEDQSLSLSQLNNAIHIKALQSAVNPGDAVGALCAQAIGEPLTQMTLNTFHFAGRDELNVTLGVPRMVEILRTASENISTPIMEIPFLPHVSRAQAEYVKTSFKEVPLSHVLHKVDVKEHFDSSSYTVHRAVTIKFSFLPYEQYRENIPVKPPQVLEFVECSYLRKYLIKDLKEAFNVKSAACSTRRDMDKVFELDDANNDIEQNVDEPSERVQQTADADGQLTSDEEIEEAPEELGSGMTSRKSKAKEQDYSEDDEEELQTEVTPQQISEDEGLGEEEPLDDELQDNQDTPVATKSSHQFRRKETVNEMEAVKRCNQVLALDTWVSKYAFDVHDQLWCEVTLTLPVSKSKYDIPTVVRLTAEKAFVHNVPHIKRAFVEDKGNQLLLRTEGINIYKICEYEHLLDINRLYTNNIQIIAQLFGIEAAQRSIIREIRAVQSAYDIKVDFRHLTLLADYFTCEGVYKACSRYALNSCRSPLQQMSYETCTHFLRCALVSGEKDNLNSPTANVALGQPLKVGTNVMDLLMKLN